MTGRTLYTNLASYPLKNRRLFFLLLAVLGALCVFLCLLGVYTFFSYAKENKDFRAKKSHVESRMQQFEREENTLTTKINQAAKEHKKNVDRMNSLIYRKSFSWVSFLSDMEEVLPSSCYIVSLSPSVGEGSQIGVRFKVAAPNLAELLKLNNRLYEMKFKDIRVISESQTREGFLLSEISVVYEKNS